MTAMGKFTFLAALFLIGLGLGLYLSSKAATALIPAYVGLVLLVCAVLSVKESRRALVMHIAALVGTIGALGGLGMGLKGGFGDKGFQNTAVTGQLGMGLICLFFVIGCVRSFKAARAKMGGEGAVEEEQSDEP